MTKNISWYSSFYGFILLIGLTHCRLQAQKAIELAEEINFIELTYKSADFALDTSKYHYEVSKDGSGKIKFIDRIDKSASWNFRLEYNWISSDQALINVFVVETEWKDVPLCCPSKFFMYLNQNRKLLLLFEVGDIIDVLDRKQEDRVIFNVYHLNEDLSTALRINFLSKDVVLILESSERRFPSDPEILYLPDENTRTELMKKRIFDDALSIDFKFFSSLGAKRGCVRVGTLIPDLSIIARPKWSYGGYSYK